MLAVRIWHGGILIALAGHRPSPKLQHKKTWGKLLKEAAVRTWLSQRNQRRHHDSGVYLDASYLGL